MSASKNAITGDAIQTKQITEQYRNNYDLIFGKKVKTVVQSTDSQKDKLDDKSVPEN